MGSFLGGCATGIVGLLLGYALLPNNVALCAIIGFCIGFAVIMLAMEVVESGVATLFVSFAMDPQALQRNDPYLYQKLRDTYNINWV